MQKKNCVESQVEGYNIDKMRKKNDDTSYPQVEEKDFEKFLSSLFGKEHINTYVNAYGLPTIILVGKGLMGSDLNVLNKAGWTIAGIHANQENVLQIGFRDLAY